MSSFSGKAVVIVHEKKGNGMTLWNKLGFTILGIGMVLTACSKDNNSNGNGGITGITITDIMPTGLRKK